MKNKIASFIYRKEIRRQEALKNTLKFALTQQPNRNIKKPNDAVKPNEQE